MPVLVIVARGSRSNKAEGHDAASSVMDGARYLQFLGVFYVIKVIALDVFGTVFDLSVVPRSEIKAYAEHIRRPDW